VGLLFALKWDFPHFPILGLLGAMRGGLQLHKRKTKRKKELPFSTTTPIHFIFLLFCSLPSIAFVA
jgi:hypothetical protein